MANIVQYQPNQNPTGAINGPRASMTDPIGQALEGFGQTLGQASDRVQKYEEEKDVFEAQKAVSQAQIDWQKKIEEAKRTAPEGAPDFTKKLTEDYDNWSSNAGDFLQTRAGRQYFTLQTDKMKLGVLNEGMSFEAQAYAQKQKTDLKNIMTENTNLVRANPGKLGEIVAQSQALIAATPFWDNQQRSAAQQLFSTELHDSALDGRVAALEANENVSPGQIAAVRAEISAEKGEWQKNTSPNMYDGALKRLSQLEKSTREKSDGLALLDFHERMDQKAATGSDPVGYTEETAASLGKTPVDKARLVKEFRAATSLGEETTRSQDTSLTEDAQRVDALGANLATTDNFKADEGQFKAAVTAFKQKRQEFSADPAGYTIKTSPSTSWAYKKFSGSQSPETWQNFATVTAFDQKRIGGPDIIPKLLPKAYIDSIASKMAEIPKSEAGATQAAQTLGEMQTTFGKSWPKAANELRAAKALDDNSYVAANLMASDNGKLAAEVLIAGGRDKAELITMSGMTEKRAREAAVNALGPLSKSLALAPDGNAIAGAYVDSLARVILYRGAIQGKNSAGQASDIARQMILNNYEFRDTMRIPRNRDVDSVIRGTKSIENNLGAMDLVVPPSNISPDIAKDSYTSSIAAHGYWVTAPDESGAYLVNGTGDPVYERSGGQVKRVQRSWVDLEAQK